MSTQGVAIIVRNRLGIQTHLARLIATLAVANQDKELEVPIKETLKSMNTLHPNILNWVFLWLSRGRPHAVRAISRITLEMGQSFWAPVEVVCLAR